METILREMKRSLEVNGEAVTVDELLRQFSEGDIITVKLPKQKVQAPNFLINNQQAAEIAASTQTVHNVVPTTGHTYLVKVRQYMTKPSTPEFDFHDKWNNGIPMPFRIMKFHVLKETRGMVYGDAWGVPLKTDNCIRCGRALTHPVSRLYGIGPECGGHAHINPFETKEELYAALDQVKAQLAAIKWTGWIIKSAVEECVEVCE